jgi:hypothetical protein
MVTDDLSRDRVSLNLIVRHHMYLIILISSLTAPGSWAHTYKTVQEARIAGVFERFLPDVLPASSKNILVKHRFDSSGYSGGFCFNARERPTFFAKLSDTIDIHVWGEDYVSAMSAFGKAGVHPWAFDSSRGNWIFLCADGSNCCNWEKR